MRKTIKSLEAYINDLEQANLLLHKRVQQQSDTLEVRRKDFLSIESKFTVADNAQRWHRMMNENLIEIMKKAKH